MIVVIIIPQLLELGLQFLVLSMIVQKKEKVGGALRAATDLIPLIDCFLR